MALEHAPEWTELNVNHLEGRTAGFFCHADEGGTEIGDDGRPKLLRRKAWFNPEEEPFEHLREAYRPLVWQRRCAGVEVPDALWRHCTTGKNTPYNDNQAEDMIGEAECMTTFDAWADAFASHVGGKGKVEPGRWRACGYEPPGHRLADAKLAVQSWRMRLGHARGGSSPRVQDEFGLNDDAVIRTKKGDGARLRE